MIESLCTALGWIGAMLKLHREHCLAREHEQLAIERVQMGWAHYAKRQGW